MPIEIQDQIPCLVISAPHWWNDPEFLHYLNTEEMASWHKGGDPGEYSDCFFTFDNKEGSDSPYAEDEGIPSHLWQELCTFMEERQIRSALIWLSGSFMNPNEIMSEHEKIALVKEWKDSIC